MDYTNETNNTISQNESVENLPDEDENEELNRFVENFENLTKKHQQQQLLAIEAPPIDQEEQIEQNLQQQQQLNQPANDNQSHVLSEQQMIQNNFNLFLTAANDNRNDDHMNIDEDLNLNIEEDEFYATTAATTSNNINITTNENNNQNNELEVQEQANETNVSDKQLPSKSPVVRDSPVQSFNLQLSNDSHITNDTYSLIERHKSPEQLSTIDDNDDYHDITETVNPSKVVKINDNLPKSKAKTSTDTQRKSKSPKKVRKNKQSNSEIIVRKSSEPKLMTQLNKTNKQQSNEMAIVDEFIIKNSTLPQQKASSVGTTCNEFEIVQASGHSFRELIIKEIKIVEHVIITKHWQLLDKNKNVISSAISGNEKYEALKSSERQVTVDYFNQDTLECTNDFQLKNISQIAEKKQTEQVTDEGLVLKPVEISLENQEINVSLSNETPFKRKITKKTDDEVLQTYFKKVKKDNNKRQLRDKKAISYVIDDTTQDVILVRDEQQILKPKNLDLTRDCCVKLTRLDSVLVKKSKGRYKIDSNGNLLPRTVDQISSSESNKIVVIAPKNAFRIIENDDVPEVVHEETVVSVHDLNNHDTSHINKNNNNGSYLYDADYSYHYYANNSSNSLLVVEEDEIEECFNYSDIEIKVDDKIFAKNASKYGTFYPARIVKILPNDSYLISFLHANKQSKCIHKRDIIPVSNLRRDDKIKFHEDPSSKKYTSGCIISLSDDSIEARSDKNDFVILEYKQVSISAKEGSSLLKNSRRKLNLPQRSKQKKSKAFKSH